MAAPIDVNGKTVLKMRLHAPIREAWVARLTAASTENLVGAVTISDGTNRWAGTVVRSGVLFGVCSALIVGGSGHLSDIPTAKSYTGVTARSVVQDLLNAAGEVVDGNSLTRPALRTVLEHWTRAGVDTTVGAELTAVLDAVGATWRVLPSGKIWIGTPTFPAAKPRGFLENTRSPDAARVHAQLDLLELLPDSSVNAERVGDVEYELGSSELRATYWLEAA